MAGTDWPERTARCVGFSVAATQRLGGVFAASPVSLRGKSLLYARHSEPAAGVCSGQHVKVVHHERNRVLRAVNAVMAAGSAYVEAINDDNDAEHSQILYPKD